MDSSLRVVALALALALVLVSPATAQAPGEAQVERLAGPDRVATALAVSRHAFAGGAPAVVLARADAYPDALAGAPLAAVLRAPILLTAPDRLSPGVADEIRRLGARRVVLLGGPSALSGEVGRAAAASAGEIVRYAGSDRFDTARVIAEAVLDASGDGEVYVALGAHPDPAKGWPDAVALSALAAARRRPVLLTGGGELAPAVTDLLRARTPDRITVVGGPAAIGDDLLQPLRGIAPVERIAGADRYATSVAIAERALADGVDGRQVWLATGRAHADALTGGAAAAATGGVLLLVDADSWSTSPVRAFLSARAAGIDRALLLGGEAAIPAHILDLLRALLARILPAPAPDPTPAPDPDPDPAPTPGPAPEPPADGRGVRVEVGDDLQSVVDAQPPGTRFVLAAGVHRLQSLRPRDGDTFVGESGAVLSGARLLAPEAFRRDAAGRWVADGQTQEASRSGFYGSTPWYEGNHHYAEPGSEAEVHYGEELFVDGDRRRRVNALAQVDRPGTWFFDHDADRIVLFDDPRGHLVETSAVDTAVQGEGVTDVTIDNLTVRHYGNRAQRGALDATGSRGWTVRNVTVEDNHGGGLGVGDAMLVANCRVAGNGQIGIVGGGSGSTVTATEVTANRQLGFQVHWEAGGTKFTNSEDLEFSNNWVHDNRGIGLWFDIGNRGATIRSNRIERNATAGLLWEISHDADIYWNELADNHTSGDLSASFGNVQVVASTGVRVHHNLLRGGGTQEIMLNHQDREPGLTDVLVAANDVTIDTAWGGGTTGLNDQGAGDPYRPEAGVRFERNTFRLTPGSSAEPFAWGGTTRSAAEWRRISPTDTVLETAEPGTLPPDAVPFSPASYGSR